MTSPKAVCILFQALTAILVIELSPYKLVLNKGLNNLPVEETVLLLFCISEQSVNHLSKIDDNITEKLAIIHSG